MVYIKLSKLLGSLDYKETLLCYSIFNKHYCKSRKWDKSTKSLSNHGLFQVEKTDNGLLARLK